MALPPPVRTITAEDPLDGGAWIRELAHECEKLLRNMREGPEAGAEERTKANLLTTILLQLSRYESAVRATLADRAALADLRKKLKESNERATALQSELEEAHELLREKSDLIEQLERQMERDALEQWTTPRIDPDRKTRRRSRSLAGTIKRGLSKTPNRVKKLIG